MGGICRALYSHLRDKYWYTMCIWVSVTWLSACIDKSQVAGYSTVNSNKIVIYFFFFAKSLWFKTQSIPNFDVILYSHNNDNNNDNNNDKNKRNIGFENFWHLSVPTPLHPSYHIFVISENTSPHYITLNRKQGL